MDAQEMTFGIEIECVIPLATCPMVGGYHAAFRSSVCPKAGMLSTTEAFGQDGASGVSKSFRPCSKALTGFVRFESCATG